MRMRCMHLVAASVSTETLSPNYYTAPGKGRAAGAGAGGVGALRADIAELDECVG